MLKEKWIIVTTVLLLGIGLFFSLLIRYYDFSDQLDFIGINRIVKYTEENWGQLKHQDTSNLAYQFSVLDNHDMVIFQTDQNTAASITEAIKNHYTIIDVNKNNQQLGKVLINTSYLAYLEQKMDTLAGTVLSAYLLITLAIAIYFLYLNKKIVRPFQQLTAFANNISYGNFDIPLVMDKKNLFGPFTESFDIMREELAKAKHQEALANKSKKELVASLSHDIKTPVTSIKLISELLEVTVKDELVKNKIQTIYQKAEQIDQLITNLFQASLQELEQLSVTISEQESYHLVQMIKNADHYHHINMNQIPDCLIKVDPLRMQQIIDNIINNSVKYAGTKIDITFTLIDEFIKIIITDYGPGVLDEEILHLPQKYFRGQKAIDDQKDGSGIGLYLCSYLMEQMDGSIRFMNQKNGFTTELLIPLSH